MNKTVTVNISGFIFNIEESAYEALQKYLEALRRQFRHEEGGEEIVADIEARIAELFQDTLSDTKQVITLEDVDAIVAQLGAPEDYMEAEEDASSSQAHTQSEAGGRSYASDMRSEHRKLYRDEDDSVIAGVASGLGHYLNVDPVILRVAFLIAFFLGFGFLTYVILWIAVPSAKTTSEKLRMKNRNINVDSIRDEYKSADKSDLNRATSNFLDVVTNMLKGLATVIRTFFGILFLAGAAFMVLGAIYALFGFDLFFDNPYLMTWEEIYEVFIPHHSGFQLGVAGAILVHIAMTIGLVYVGLRLLKRVGDRYRSIRWIAPVALILGGILLSFGITSNAVQFSQSEEVREEIHTEFGAGDTVALGFLNPLDLKIYHRHNHGLRMEYSTLQGETVYSGGVVSLNYRPTSEDHMYLEIIRESDGRTTADARVRAENIIYDTQVDSTGIQLSPYIGYPRSDTYRGQGVEVRIYIPDGMVLTNDLEVRQNLRHTRHHGISVIGGEMRLLNADLEPFEDDFYTRYYYFY